MQGPTRSLFRNGIHTKCEVSRIDVSLSLLSGCIVYVTRELPGHRYSKLSQCLAVLAYSQAEWGL